jgi:hypothetical protein
VPYNSMEKYSSISLPRKIFSKTIICRFCRPRPATRF